MSGLKRKNLVVDEEKVRALAKQLGMSESAAVREAVDRLLLAQEFEEVVSELHAAGGIEDVFHQMPGARVPEVRHPTGGRP
jgi:hypothetical protein